MSRNQERPAANAAGSVDLAKIRGLAPALYTEPVVPRETALVIVDMQQGFCRPDRSRSRVVARALRAGKIAPFQAWMESVIANNRKLLDLFRGQGLRIVHVTLGCWTEDGGEMAPHYRRADAWRRTLGLTPRRQGRLPDFRIVPELAPRRGEIVLQKVTPSAFPSTGIDCILRNLGMRYLVMGGMITQACLGATALDASFHYAVTIAGDACIAPNEKAAHDAWLRMFSQHWGRVLSTEAIAREIRGTAG